MSTAALEYLRNHRESHISLLDEFVRIPSQSGTPELKGEVRRAAKWLVEGLRKAGGENIEILDTKGHPAVYADWLHAESAPTVLIYGHYDVQPPEPLELWESPPYAPEVREGKLFGRGATDDKAGVTSALLALEAMLKSGELPSVNLKFCFEGEEETGSANLEALLLEHRERFAADLAVSVDGAHWSVGQPQVVLGLRGAIAGEILVSGPDHDLHSGLFGGAVLNPAEALCSLIASVRDPNGRIAIDGFYDDVLELPAKEREAIAKIPGTEESLLAESGVSELYGEAGYSPIERTWVRPTFEINGICSGHTEAGLKTIIPAHATAKFSCRLVANQDPSRIVACIRRHVERHTPTAVKAELKIMPVQANPYSMRADHPANLLLIEILESVFGRAPYQAWIGGSVPVIDMFQQILGIDTVSVGFSISNCNLHAPNEFVHLETMHLGTESLVLLLRGLATVLS
ncbi:Peptidase family M20/M25/M40 [Verrucomicrobiia bacterium DG1235]|nr:Peptidase family M20/M25/M40 [Verrucomicrobiae bacterium DG1235]